MDRIDVRGVKFDNVDLEQAADIFMGFFEESGRCRLVFTPNSEIVQMCIEDGKVKETVNSADLLLADGIGVVYASRILGRPLRGKVAGFDFAVSILARLAQSGKKLFLLGSAPGVAEAAAKRMRELAPGLDICGVHDGYFKEDAPVIDEINTSGADVVFVCLGAPKQELWMAKNREAVRACAMIGLGGSLDVLSGRVKRAPDIFIKLGLEWFYRLIKEPWRYKRMMKLPVFLFGAIKERIFG